MYLFLTILFLFISNSLIYLYAIKSNEMWFIWWKILLIPLILFPIIYFTNILFSWAFIFWPKWNLSISSIWIINIAIWNIVVVLWHIFYYKQVLDTKMIIWIILVMVGAILIGVKT